MRVVDRHPYPSPDVPTVVGDLRDPAVRAAAVTPDLTGVIHLAAETSVLGSLARPAQVHEVNVGATAALLELSRVHGVGRFVMTSTNAVVGDRGGQTLHEDLPLRPLTPYGATKAAAVKAGTPVQVYGDGGQRRDFVHVRDAVAGLLTAWRAGHLGPLVIGAGRSVGVLDLLAAAGEVIGRPVPVEHVDAKAGEMPAVIVSIDRARALGYRPSVGLAEGLATVWDEFR